MNKKRIAVVGAGIGGMTTAVALSQKGMDVTIFEQAPTLSEVGAGLTITPNATKGLMYLNLGKEIEKIGMAHEHQGVRHYKTGEMIVPLHRGKKMLEQYGAYQFQLHRADIHDVLIKELKKNSPDSIFVNHQLCGIEETSESVELKFTNNKKYEFDFVIGADGNKSTVRNIIIGDDDPEFAGYVAWRGLVATKDLSEGDFDECGSSAFISPGRVFARYLVRNGDIYNYVGFLTTDEWAEEGWSIPSKVETVLNVFSDYNQQVKNIIAATPPDRCYKWGIFTRKPINKWSSEKVTLLGDAAHPVVPFMGQGATMAIEDAVVIGRIIDDSSSPSEIINRYENARVERAHFIMEHSKKAGERFTGANPDKYTKEDHMNEEELGLFNYDPGSVIV
ncbi:MAG: NAD(P)-binding protein [Gammaproteobacteria bacterium]|jgi:salicylate hydroxylase|nr:NAD(P)-binding protein [Gammaproteobacteria bacterium]MBT7753935.1 NAD(P)-binding protein [Gammaproteobacteria bacterium]